MPTRRELVIGAPAAAIAAVAPSVALAAPSASDMIHPHWWVTTDDGTVLFDSNSYNTVLAWVRKNRDGFPGDVYIGGHYCPYIPKMLLS